jgi:hypothetical protein
MLRHDSSRKKKLAARRLCRQRDWLGVSNVKFSTNLRRLFGQPEFRLGCSVRVPLALAECDDGNSLSLPGGKTTAVAASAFSVRICGAALEDFVDLRSKVAHNKRGIEVAAYLVANFEVEDYDAWKQRFDSDPAGRKQSGKGHVVSRSADNPNDVFVRVEFDSVDEAKAFRERLLASPALENVTIKMQPTVIEVADEATY